MLSETQERDVGVILPRKQSRATRTVSDILSSFTNEKSLFSEITRLTRHVTSPRFEHRCAQETFVVRLIPRGVYYPDRVRRLSAVVEEGPEHRRASATLPASCLRSGRLINAATSRAIHTCVTAAAVISSRRRRVSTRNRRVVELYSCHYRAETDSTWLVSETNL